VKLTRRHKQLIAGASVVFVVLALLVGIVINNAVFSPAALVQQYLSALARGDAASALSMPGIGDKIPAGADRTLLRGSALGEISDISVTSVEGDNDETVVTARYTLGETMASGEFVLTRTGNNFGVFEGWAFAELPVAEATVTVLHDAAFDIGNSGAIDLRSTPSGEEATVWGGTGTFLVFAPGNYVLSRTAKFLTSEPVELNVTTPGETVEVTVDVQANDAFNAEVQEQVDEYLEKCTEQQVLQPAGCPFGYTTGNRIIGDPTWEIDQLPVVTVVPGETTWAVIDARGTMRITGEVQSLYDGTISPLDEIVETVFSIRIVIRADGNLALTLY
jgi:hypothetical protein